jgi:HlyD family secretion protein
VISKRRSRAAPFHLGTGKLHILRRGAVRSQIVRSDDSSVRCGGALRPRLCRRLPRSGRGTVRAISSGVSTAVQSAASGSIADLAPEHPWSRRRAPAAVMAALALVGVGLAAARHFRRAAPPPIRYETAAVSRGPLQARVTASGSLSALVTVQVGSQVSGRIQELLVDFNTPVRKGQVIARIEPLLFQAAVEQAAANDSAAASNLDKARFQLADAERQAQRMEALWDSRVVARADVDTVETNLGVARAQKASAESTLRQTHAALHQARINLAYTRIVSPIDGVVISRNVDAGQTVAASFQSPTLFVIAEDLRKMQVDTSVAEADVGKLAAGMAAQFTVDAYPSEIFRGRIREVRNAPQTVQNVVTYDAVIDVDNGALKLKPGMTANVTVVHADRRDCLKIANAALRFRPSGELAARRPPAPAAATPDARTVWALRDGHPRPIAVRIGVTDGIATELLGDDVRPGDLLVTEMSGGGKGGPGSFGRVF